MSEKPKDILTPVPPKKIERRKGLDRRGKIGIALSLAGGVLWGAGLYLAYYGYPQQVTFFDRLFNKTVRTEYEPVFFFVSEALWGAGVVLCALSLVQFRKRYRRRADKKHMGIITMLILNALSFIIFGIFSAIMGF